MEKLKKMSKNLKNTDKVFERPTKRSKNRRNFRKNAKITKKRKKPGKIVEKPPKMSKNLH